MEKSKDEFQDFSGSVGTLHLINKLQEINVRDLTERCKSFA